MSILLQNIIKQIEKNIIPAREY